MAVRRTSVCRSFLPGDVCLGCIGAIWQVEGVSNAKWVSGRLSWDC